MRKGRGLEFSDLTPPHQILQLLHTTITAYLHALQDVGPATAVLRCTDSLSQAMAAANVHTLQSVVCGQRSQR